MPCYFTAEWGRSRSAATQLNTDSQLLRKPEAKFGGCCKAFAMAATLRWGHSPYTSELGLSRAQHSLLAATLQSQASEFRHYQQIMPAGRRKTESSCRIGQVLDVGLW